MKKALKRQPYNPMGPFPQAAMVEAKRLNGKKAWGIFRPWKTGKTYPYRSAKRSVA